MEVSESSGGHYAVPTPARAPDSSASFLQVVVEKHKRPREQSATPRLPAATSSPPPTPGIAGDERKRAGAGDGCRCCGAGPPPAPALLLLCPWPPDHVPPPGPVPSVACHYLRAGTAGTADATGAGDGGTGGRPPLTHAEENHATSWKIFSGDADTYEAIRYDDESAGGAGEPECVEVYRFLRVGGAGGAGLATSAHGRGSRVQRRSARWARAARAAAAELGAGARLAAAAPLHAALLALRCSLQVARDAGAGAAHAVSDYGLKPALALLFNALLHPVLVFAANVLQGLREAMAPGAGALRDCAEPVAVLLRAARLVEVHSPCHCERR